MFTAAEIGVYSYVLQYPGCSSTDVALNSNLSPDVTAATLSSLLKDGFLDSWLVVERRGADQKRYEALRGSEPIEAYQNALAAEHRRRRASGRGLKSPVRHSRAPGSCMRREEWEVLIINYEMANPGEGWRLIENHTQDRLSRGEPIIITMDDYDRLRRRARALMRDV